jgi:hypothetical protein
MLSKRQKAVEAAAMFRWKLLWLSDSIHLRLSASSPIQNPGGPSLKDDHNENWIDLSDVCDLDYSSRCECAANHRYGQHHMRPISGRFGGDLAAYFQRSPVSADMTVSRVDFLAPVSASKNSVPGDWISRPGGARESAAGR